MADLRGVQPLKKGRESSAQAPSAHGSHSGKSAPVGKAARDSLCLAPAIPFRSFPPTLSALKRHGFPCCPGTELRRWESLSSSQVLPSSHRLTGKSFWKGGVRGGRTFFQKGFPLRKLFFLQISRRLPGVSQTKNPRRSGDKKRPPRAESCKGVSNNLWQRPTFPHDVMQYHRRWRA